jgi:hypothetical protein
MRFAVTTGARYAIGISLPFLLSKAVILEWAKFHGFTSILVRDRPDKWPYPQRPATYSDDWDTLIEATYGGTLPSIEAPAPPAWMLRIDFAARDDGKKKTRARRRKSKRPPKSESAR